jgi:hypothetical protein
MSKEKAQQVKNIVRSCIEQGKPYIAGLMLADKDNVDLTEQQILGYLADAFEVKARNSAERTRIPDPNGNSSIFPISVHELDAIGSKAIAAELRQRAEKQNA